MGGNEGDRESKERERGGEGGDSKGKEGGKEKEEVRGQENKRRKG